MGPAVKVVLQYAAGPWLQGRLAALAGDGIDVRFCEETDRARFRALMAEAEVVWHVLMPITAEVIAGAPRLKLIQKIGVGLNTIDLEAARTRGVKVCNMPETNSRAVAEMTLALMLAALRRLPTFDRVTRQGQGWPLDPKVQDDLGELAGRNVGLVGFGAVPRLLVPVLRALGARVLYTARAPKPGADAEWRALSDLLAESDVISLHVPLTPDTERMIDKAAIARMKPGTVLVNTARGGLIDEAALVAALASGRIRAAGLDVFALEPVDADNPLLRLDNVVLTPHVAWLTAETWQRSLAVAVENCRRLAAGQPLLHQVA
jgi:phosphoglycerate dehydrogenase-like enzyme